MKIFFSIIFILFISIVIPSKCSAADTLYTMLHADEVESLEVYQDAIIVGQLIEKKSNMFTVKVLKIISGNLPSDKIYIPENSEFSWRQEPKLYPKINDYCIMSLKKHGDYYQVALGIFKANSGNYKKLKLITRDMNYLPGIKTDIACLEWFVNSGGIEKDFIFKGDNNGNLTAYVKYTDGKIVKIYPKSVINLIEIIGCVFIIVILIATIILKRRLLK